VQPVQPLYDVLPSPAAGAPDFTISASPSVAVSAGRTATSRILIMPRGAFDGPVNLTASGLPAGVTASFSPADTAGSRLMTLTADPSSASVTTAVTISGVAGGLSHSVSTSVSVTPVLTNTVPVNLSSAFNVTGIYNDGTKFETSASLDGGGYAFSEEALGTEQVGAEVVFKLGPAGASDMVSSKTVDLPRGKFGSLRILATAVNGTQETQAFTVNYADGTSSSFTQSLSDWAGSANLPGESPAARMPYRLVADGSTDANPFIASAYTFTLDAHKEVRSVTLPANRNVLVLAMTLVSAEK
jgi:alpha-mannosidase